MDKIYGTGGGGGVSGSMITIYGAVGSGGGPTLVYPSTKGEEKMGCGISMNCTVPAYAWGGLNFFLICIGLSILVLAVAGAYRIYKGN